MQSRQFNFYALFERYLEGDIKATSLLYMHIEQSELTREEVKYLLKILNEEISKPDSECNTNALALAGLLYLRGDYVEASFEKAVSFIDRAIVLGNPKALNHKGLILAKQGKHAESILFYDKAAQLNDPMAISNLALKYKIGSGVSKDHQKAIYWYEKAISLENPYAYSSFANLYRSEIGPSSINYTRAIELLEKGIAFGHADSMYIRATMHEFGQGGDIDLSSAISLYERAVTLNHVYAPYNLIKLYLKKMLTVKNERKSAKLYRQIVIANHLPKNEQKEISELLQKSKDLQVKYHLLLASSQQCELSAEFLPFFNQHPDEVAQLVLKDDLLSGAPFKEATAVIGEHYLKKANQYLQNIERGIAPHDESFLQLLDCIPEMAPQYIASLTMKIDYIANTLSDNIDLPERLLFIESLHQIIMEHDIKTLEEKHQRMEEATNQLANEKMKQLKNEEKDILALQQEIEFIQKLRYYQEPIKNFIYDLESSYWTSDKSCIEKHIQSYAHDRLVLDNYVLQCQSFLEVLKSLIFSYQKDNKIGLWQGVLSSNLLFLQSDIKSAIVQSANPCPTPLLEAMVSITKRIQCGKQSSHKKETAFCEKAEMYLPQLQPMKREARVSMK